MRRVVAALAVLLSGCIMDLPTGVRIERPRVLGARVVIEGEPTRASPRPGEEVALEWMTVPRASTWTHALSACVGAPSNQGLPACASEPFAIDLALTPSATPRFVFTVPPDARGPILVLGVLCADGTPAVSSEEGELPTCEGEAATRELLTFSVAVTAEGPANQHPAWSEDALRIEDDIWPPPPADLDDDAGCRARSDLPQLAWADEETPVVVRFATRPEDRERFMALVLGETPTFEERDEELLVTHVASAGTFVRLQTEVFDDTSAEGEIPWRHPPREALPADGLVVRFFFVLRDGRGGMDWTERAACVVP